ncbi:MAG: hypothetical protein GC159_18580 [Phycisphaera sp.]|nr:hypothetical protein [Phycisphaera sp.]
MATRTTRRTFIQHVGYAGASLPVLMPALVRAQSANSKLNVAFVGTGGRAAAHTGQMSNMGQNCVCFADVNKGAWGGVLGKKTPGWSDAKGYTDWRKIFENHEKEIDTVFVAVPDHTHFAPSMTAVSLGKNCYTEKPLCWSVKECQLLAAAYHKNDKVVTQMGNQGHAGSGWRIAYELYKAGAIGDVVEFHTWTNRPVWPQGWGRPAGTNDVPDSLDWESWIGAAEMRPYCSDWTEAPFAKDQKDWKHKVYHPFAWRGVRDFGSGALGDMACHTTDGIHSLMEPDYPISVEPVHVSPPVKDADSYQIGGIYKWEYPAKDGKPAFKAFWYEGYKKIGDDGRFHDEDKYFPDKPEELGDRNMPRTGNIIVGTKGKMLVTGDYWNSARLIPEEKHQEFINSLPNKKLPELVERSPGHHEEFVMACRGEKPREFSRSNWGYAGPMTAKIQLGNVVARVGKKIECDTKTGIITNIKEANDLLWREPRKGWGPLAMNV